MTSTFQNYSYSPNLQEHVLFSPPNVYDHDAKANTLSSPSLLTRDFFSSINDQHQEYYSGSYYHHKELQEPHIQLDQVNDDFASNGGSCDYIENESSENGLKFSIWKKEDHTSAYNDDQTSNSTKYQVKWISSETSLMQKMNINTDPTDVNAPRMKTTSVLKLEDQKQPSLETDNTSNTTSSNTMISNINHPIRVCSDCNTTKTPLWRSGPQGPKSLCNACGIRQRKARRAMAAANGTISTGTETKPPVLLIKKTKTTPQKHKTKKSSIHKGSSSSSAVSKFKNQVKMAATSSSHQDKKKKLCLEDFLLSLSKNLAFYTVFPQDEKEAAILLMALSFGHAHGKRAAD